MVHLILTCTVIEYSLFVKTPKKSINSHRNWTLHKCIKQSPTGEFAFIACHFVGAISALAVLVLGNIRVRFFCINSFLLHVKECILQLSAVTSFVAVWSAAIDELLFRKQKIYSLVDQISALQSSYRAKGPTRGAHPLIFDLCHFSLLLPVNLDLVVQIHIFGQITLDLRRNRYFEAHIHLAKLQQCQISECVNLKCVIVIRIGVVNLNLVFIVLINLMSIVLFSGMVLLGVMFLKLSKGGHLVCGSIVEKYQTGCNCEHDKQNFNRHRIIIKLLRFATINRNQFLGNQRR